MPRKIVPLVTGETYHVFNRGVDKRSIFQDKVDYFRFHQSMQVFNDETPVGSMYRLQWNEDGHNKPLVRVHAYCLLKNHFHLLITQAADGGISEFMKRLSGGYTSYFNERHERSGALFQGNYKRVLCETNEQLLYLAAYVNLNNEVHVTKDYFLSSYDAYIGKRSEDFVAKNLVLEQYANVADFSKNAKRTVRNIAAKRALDKEYLRDQLHE